MSEVFADAFYYIALLNPDDRHHSDAVEATKNLRRRIVTSVWVLIEVADAFSSPRNRPLALRFLDEIAIDPNVTIIADVEPWLSRGIALFRSRLDKSWSLTDCISFEVMKDRSVSDALTGDRHFAQAGFQAVMTAT